MECKDAQPSGVRLRASVALPRRYIVHGYAGITLFHVEQLNPRCASDEVGLFHVEHRDLSDAIPLARHSFHVEQRGSADQTYTGILVCSTWNSLPTQGIADRRGPK